MSQQPFRGVFTIPSTPFMEDGSVDWPGLRRVVDFCVGCGAHGLVWPVNASAFAALTDAERLEGMGVVVEHTAGRIPVILGVQGVSDQHAALFSARAAELAADGVIAMAPYVQELEDEAAVVRYFRAIDRAVDVPIFVQNHSRGMVFSASTLALLVEQIEHVEYIKEETFPATHRLTEALACGGPKLRGVFGGAGGRYLLLEHPRGVAGQMPGCHVTDVVVQLWNALEAGSRAEAKRLYGLLAPLFALETLKGTYYPEVLRRRQVIGSAYSRHTVDAPTRDARDDAALDEILADLEPVFTWTGPPVLYGAAAATRRAGD